MTGGVIVRQLYSFALDLSLLILDIVCFAHLLILKQTYLEW